MAESSYDGCLSEGLPRRQPAREPTARTYARALPIVPVRARGLTIEGADGRRYLDCLSGAGTLALGHNHPVVLEAIRKVLDSGAPLHALDLATPVEDAFVTELFRTLPPGLADHARVQFCGPGGADAKRAALELVRAATGRTGILAFTGACHDTTITTREAFDPPGEVADLRVTWLPCPRGHRRTFGGGRQGAELAARWTESLLDDYTPGAPAPAGVIVEAVQSEGEVIPAPDAWMRRMRQITVARSIPLIADEIHTGVGRTGAFWAVEHSGVTPDVMVLSKAIGGSLPLSVLVYRDDLDVREHGAPTGMFRGNQLALAAGAATLAHVRENGLAERASLLGERMLSRLRDLGRQFSCVGEARGRGLMLGLGLVDPDREVGGREAGGRGDGGDRGETCCVRACGAGGGGIGTDALRRGCVERAAAGPCLAAPELAAAVQRECLRRGLIVELGGPHTSVVRLVPPLTISDEQADAVLDRLSDAVEVVARGHTPRAHILPGQKDPPEHEHHRRGDHPVRAGQPPDR